MARRLGNRVKTYDQWRSNTDIYPQEVNVVLNERTNDLLSVNPSSNTQHIDATNLYPLIKNIQLKNEDTIKGIINYSNQTNYLSGKGGPCLYYLVDDTGEFAFLIVEELLDENEKNLYREESLFYKGKYYHRAKQNDEEFEGWREVGEDRLKSHSKMNPLDHPNLSVTEEKLADKAVTSKKIGNNAVGISHIDRSLIKKNMFNGTVFITNYDNLNNLDIPYNENISIYKLSGDVGMYDYSGLLFIGSNFDIWNNDALIDVRQTRIDIDGKIFTRVSKSVENNKPKTWSDWELVNNGSGAEIADDSISTSKIQNGAVTKEKLHKDLVNELNGDILNNSIDGSKIMDKAIQNRHLSSEVAGSIYMNKFDRTIEEFEIDNYSYSYSEPSAIYKVAGSHPNLEGGILIVSNEIESPTHLKNINNTYIKHSGEILTRYAIMTGDLLSPPKWSEWQSIYVTNTLMDEHKSHAVLDHPDGSVTTEKIADEAITNKKIRQNSISGEHLMPMSITNRELDANAVRTSRIQDGAVTKEKIADNAITNVKMSDNAIATNNIQDQAVTEDKIRQNAIFARHIQEGAVEKSKLAKDSVDTDQIINRAVTGSKIAENTIKEDNLSDNSIASRHIKAGVITASQLDNNLYNKIVNNTFDGVIETNAIDDYEFPIKNGVLIYKLNDSNIANDYGGLLLVYAYYAKRSDSSTGETRYTLEAMRQAKILIGTGQVYTRYASRSATTKPSKWSEWAQVSGGGGTANPEDLVGQKTEAGGEIFNDYENNSASGYYSHAEGSSTTAEGCASHAEGYKTYSSKYSHAEGLQSRAEGENSHAEGNSVTAKGNNSHAEGLGTKAEGKSSHTEGNNTKAKGENSHAEGYLTEAYGNYSHAEGNSNGHLYSGEYNKDDIVSSFNTEPFSMAFGQGSHVEGQTNLATGNGSHAEGLQNIAAGDGSHAEGRRTIASGEYQHVEGKYNIEDTTNTYAHIVGGGTSIDNRKNIHTIDWNGNAEFAGKVNASDLSIKGKSVSELIVGKKIENGGEIFNDYENNIASEFCSHAEGYQTNASGWGSHAEGSASKAHGEGSHAEGRRTKSTGKYAHSEGLVTTAKGENSHAEGNATEAWGKESHIEGFSGRTYDSAMKDAGNVVASTDERYGSDEHLIEVFNSKPFSLAKGDRSHVEGQRNLALGMYTHAEGVQSIAKGENSHVEGWGTIASGKSQHVQGKFNKEDTENKYAHIVGGGTGANLSQRKNIHTVDWDGNAWFAGDMEVSSVIIRSSTPGSDKKFKLTIDDTGTISVSEI